MQKAKYLRIISVLLIYLSMNMTVSASWSHLSSKDGDIPEPDAFEQTASLIMDVDQDGLNDFIIGGRNKGSSLFWFKKDSAGWKRYLIEKGTLPIEAGGSIQ